MHGRGGIQEVWMQTASHTTVKACDQMTPSSQSWIQRLTADESVRNDALGELRQLLIRSLQKSFRNRSDVSSDLLEDMVQEALMKILDSLDGFEGRSQFTTWATTIAVRTVFSELRRKRWQDVSMAQVLEDTMELAVDTDADTSPELSSTRVRLVEAMYQVIDNELTAKQRQALLVELKGLPLEEIARRMDSNRNAIYKLTHDARKRLKRGLEAMGYSSDDWHLMSR